MRINRMEFNVATYLRLSKDDGDILCAGKESNSIKNQRELLQKFLDAHPEMRLVEEYVDDGYTGLNFDRPGFQKMMEDIRTGKINCIIVKDLSRFGRDYIDGGRYLEKIFPGLGVRLIAINDGIDTLNSNEMGNGIVIPFKNLINDSYSRDTSMKVRSHLDVKRKNGECVASFAVYGYKKNPENKNQLIVDEVAAQSVKEIFFMAMDGFSADSIAKHLNEEGVLSPLEYKKANGSRYQCAFATKNRSLWNPITVRRILGNEVYTGVLLQGKTTTPNYKTKKVIQKQKEEWDRSENTHEAIISRPFFDIIQQLMKEDTRTAPGEEKLYPYSGRIFCADCGQALTRKKAKAGNKEYIYYVCSANKANSRVCSSHSIPLEELDAAVLETIQAQIRVVMDIDLAMRQIDDLAWEHSALKKIETNLAVQEQIIQKNNALRMGIYEDLREGTLDKNEFLELKNVFSARIAEATAVIEDLKASRDSIQLGVSSQQTWISQFKAYKNITDITRNVVVNLIERIVVYENKEIEVVFRHRDQFSDIMEFIEHQNEKKISKELLKVFDREVG